MEMWELRPEPGVSRASCIYDLRGKKDILNQGKKCYNARAS